MEQVGYVIEAGNGSAKVRVVRESACGGNCVSCKGCPANAVIVEGVCSERLSAGDEVILYMQNKLFYKSAFIGYGSLTLLTISGAISGYSLLGTELASVIGAGLGLAVGLCFVKFTAKSSVNKIIIKRKG